MGRSRTAHKRCLPCSINEATFCIEKERGIQPKARFLCCLNGRGKAVSEAAPAEGSDAALAPRRRSGAKAGRGADGVTPC